MANNKYIDGAKQRFKTIRLRTWVITATILIALAFWIILQVTTKDTISWLDFIVLCTVQILAHLAYFPDGEAFGRTNERYITNKAKYDELATKINNDDKYYRLRDYCAFEFEERKAQYINTMLGYVGITEKEFEQIKLLSEKEIKALKEWEITEKVNGEETKRLVHFNKRKKQILNDLIFKPIPVRRNETDTIVSGKEVDVTEQLADPSKPAKRWTYIGTVLKIVIVAVFFAYIVWDIKDGYNWLVDTAKYIMYIGCLITTATMSFTNGERIQKVYKTEFYIQLSQFIERFYEWDNTHIAKRD